MAYDPAHDAYLVVWAHDNGSDDDVHGRMVEADGDLWGSELTIAEQSGDYGLRYAMGR